LSILVAVDAFSGLNRNALKTKKALRTMHKTYGKD